MADKSVLTEAVLEMRERLGEVRKEMKTRMPAPFMQEKLTAREFKKQWGISVTQAKQLSEQYGEENVAAVMKALGGLNANT